MMFLQNSRDGKLFSSGEDDDVGTKTKTSDDNGVVNVATERRFFSSSSVIEGETGRLRVVFVSRFVSTTATVGEPQIIAVLRVISLASKSDGAREDQNQKSFVVVVVVVAKHVFIHRSSRIKVFVYSRPPPKREKKRRRSRGMRKVVEASSSSFSPFQTKLGAMVYDSGYRQLFRLLGYPGCETRGGGSGVHLSANRNTRVMQLLDVSCGPGVVTKSIVSSKMFAKVVALDYFESMCERAKETFERECTENNSYEVVRGDVSALQFANATFEKVSSTAGMHCWPNPVKGMKEIKRGC